MESEAEVGDVFAGGAVIVGGQARSLRDVAFPEEGYSGARLGNYVPAPIEAPDFDDLVRKFQGRGGDGIEVREGGSRYLEPGSYAMVDVSGHLTLTSGDYFLAGLTVRPQGRLTIEAIDGPVRIQVATAVVLGGEVLAEPGELVVELTGAGDVTIFGNLAATVYAPEGSINVAGEGRTVRGALFAERVRLAQDVTILHTDPVRLR